MPKRLLRLSRTEPARAILLVIAFITVAMQLFTLTPWYGPPEVFRFATSTIPPSFWAKLPGTFIVTAIGSWAIWACVHDYVKHMARAAFCLQALWLWSGLSRAVVSIYPFQLLWVPFVIVAVVLGIVYLYLSHERHKMQTRGGDA